MGVREGGDVQQIATGRFKTQPSYMGCTLLQASYQGAPSLPLFLYLLHYE